VRVFCECQLLVGANVSECQYTNVVPDDMLTVKPLYKHIIGNRICRLIREVCLYKGN
jgi:hypothetical protein